MCVDPYNRARNIKSKYNFMSNTRPQDKENSLKLVFTKYKCCNTLYSSTSGPLSARRKLRSNVYQIRISAESENRFQ